MLTHDDWTKIDELVYLLYSTEDIKHMRELFLVKLKEAIYYDSAFFDLCKDGRTNYSFFDPVYINIPEEYMKKYYTELQKFDYSNWIFTQHNPVTYRDTDILGDKLRESSSYFTEWFVPLGLYYGGGSSIVRNSVLLGSLTLFRTRKNGDFSKRDLSIIEILNRHLAVKLTQLYPGGIKKITENEVYSYTVTKYSLTEREQEIAELVIEGYKNNEIAATLFISEITVKKHLFNIYKKLNIDSRTRLVKELSKNRS
jgi:DNA-binding CsgD family transcriptional regulator